METLRFLIISIPATFFVFATADFLYGCSRILLKALLRSALGLDDSTSVVAYASVQNPAISTKPTTEVKENKTPPSVFAPQQSEVLAKIRALKKRDLRKILSPLGVQQKRNGKEITTQMAVAKITKLYKENPQQVIAVLCEKLPQKFSQPLTTVLTETA
ncbi:MAG: hypothetical protein SWY16_04440 [Cyanobacteriota bacterium]|nr:hypothetical protein [Cyanobacteriota bacterium]